MKSLLMPLMLFLCSFCFAQVDTVKIELGAWQKQTLENLEKQIAELQRQQQTILFTLFDSNAIVPNRIRGMAIKENELVILIEK